MLTASESLDFERAKEYRDLIQHIQNLTNKQKLCHQIKRFVMSLVIVLIKAGCVSQVFFIRQGNMIKRDTTMIPLQQTEEEEFYTFIGQFYSLNQHILPKEVHVPRNLDKEMIQSVVDTKIVQPARGPKRDG